MNGYYNQRGCGVVKIQAREFVRDRGQLIKLFLPAKDQHLLSPTAFLCLSRLFSPTPGHEWNNAIPAQGPPKHGHGRPAERSAQKMTRSRYVDR